jgi:hypothetical protein
MPEIHRLLNIFRGIQCHCLPYLCRFSASADSFAVQLGDIEPAIPWVRLSGSAGSLQKLTICAARLSPD